MHFKEMEVDEEGERIPFGCVANGHKKYGSTSRFRRKDSQTMVYKVQKGDTMQGIAVKFGVTTEQIRRTNQMWTNDSLFLRDTLLIPVSSPSTSNGSSNQQLNGSCLREAVSGDSSDSSDTEVKQKESSTSEKARSASSLNAQNEATTAV